MPPFDGIRASCFPKSDSGTYCNSVQTEFVFKKYKTCAVFPSNYGNPSGCVEELDMLWEQDPTSKSFHSFQFEFQTSTSVSLTL